MHLTMHPAYVHSVSTQFNQSINEFEDSDERDSLSADLCKDPKEADDEHSDVE